MSNNIIVLKLITVLIFASCSRAPSVILPSDIRNPSQFQLNEWSGQIQNMTIWHGNIQLDGSLITNYEAFENLSEIRGSMNLVNLNQDFKDIFPNLKIITGRDNGDGLGISYYKNQTLDFGDLEEIRTSLDIVRSPSLERIQLSKIKTIQDWLSIQENELFHTISGPEVESIGSLNIYWNSDNLQIENFSELEEINLNLILSSQKLAINNSSFERLHSVGFRIGLIGIKENTELAWLSNFENCTELGLHGEIDEDLACTLLNLAQEKNCRLDLRPYNSLEIWDNDWIIETCN